VVGARAAGTFWSGGHALCPRGRDRGGGGAVEVDSAGHLMSLSVPSSVVELGGARIEEAVMEAYGDATRRAAREMTRRAADTFGPDSETTAFLGSTFGQQLDGLGR
ncbi:MAG: hypothetical protein L0L69_10180, partial [Propionibacterium sp.]|nr:hypothetical protein [Propionibacterium sp.]